MEAAESMDRKGLLSNMNNARGRTAAIVEEAAADMVALESREAAVRAIVAAQWLTACAWLGAYEYFSEVSLSVPPNQPDVRGLTVGKVAGAWSVGAECARLPCAVDLLAGRYPLLEDN